MKKGFVIYSAVVALVMCISFLFKLMHWPGGTLMCFMSGLLGIIAVIWAACIQVRLGKVVKGAVIFNAIVLVLAIIGLWFKIAHWPGGSIICILCFSGLIPAAVIWSAISYLIRNK
ncbi:MAG: hypothetical protein IKS44_00275 [Bacteroidales bacterium]|nr:hypothetical protein [Bacteroidales bacterium]